MIDPLVNADAARPADMGRREPRRSQDFDRLLGTQVRGRADEPGDRERREGNLLEVQVIDRAGQGLAIVLPWRLMANDALSQLHSATALTAVGVQASTSQPIDRANAPDGFDARAPMPPFASFVPAQGAGVPVARVTPTHAAMGATQDVDAAMPGVMSSLAEPWQARLLRWLRSADGGLTARLRDYRLDAADEARFVERTVAFAREHGLTLQRIVVNARELWRAPP